MKNNFTIIKKGLLLFLGLIGMSALSFAQTNWRSNGTGGGNWDVATSWQVEESPGNWIAASTAPTSAEGTILIQNGDIITIAVGVTIDQATIDNGGTLTVNAGTTLIIAAGAGDDLTINSGGVLNNNGTIQIQTLPPPPVPKVALVRVSGTVNNKGVITGASTTSLFFESGAVYDHQFDTSPGAIPLASWNVNSTCKISSYTSNTTAPSGISGQTFGNFIWDTPSATGFIDLNLNGSLTTVSGNLTFLNANLILGGTGGTNFTLTVGGDLTISDSPFFNINGSFLDGSTNSGITGTLDVGGNVNLSNNAGFYFVYDGNVELHIGGNLLIDGGGINFTTGYAGNINIYLSGNCTIQNAPAINNGGSGSYNIFFEGTSLQTYASSLPLTDFDYTIQSNAIVHIPSGSSMSGSGKFTCNENAIVKLASADASGAIAGNIPVTGTITFDSGATIELNGAAPQYIGASFPENSVNLTISNPTSVGLKDNLTITSPYTLNLVDGVLNINDKILNINGGLTSNTGEIHTGSASTITIGGSSGGISSLPLDATSTQIKNLLLNKNGVTISLAQDLEVVNTLTLNQGTLDISNRTLTLSGAAVYTAGVLQSNNATRVVINTSSALGTIPFGPNSTIKTLLFKGSGSATMASTTITDTLALDNGILTTTGLIMGNGATISKSLGTLSSEPTCAAGDSYNLYYKNGSDIGNEFSSDINFVNNVEIALVGTEIINLNGAKTINGDLVLTSGTLAIGANVLTLKGGIVGTGTIKGGASSGLSIAGAGDILTIPAITDGLNTLTINRAAGATLGADLNILTNGNLALTSGALSIGAHTLNMKGSITTASGSLVGGTTSNINFDTGGNVSVPAITNGLNNLTINRGANTVTLTGIVDVKGSVTLTSGTLASTLNAFLQVDLNSGFIAYEATDLGSISGKILVYKNFSRGGYHYLATPLSNTSLGDLISTNGSEVFHSTALYYYDETGRDGTQVSGWKKATGLNFTNNGRGVAALASVAAGTIDLTGTYTHQANVSVILSNTPSVNTDNDGWNLIGNPYPSDLSWNNLVLPSGMSGEVQFYNASSDSVSGGYTAIAQDGFPAGNQLPIPPLQSFFVHATENNVTLALSNTARRSTTTPLYRTTNIYDYSIRLTVTNGASADPTYIRFVDEASASFDSKWDAHKMTNEVPNSSLYTELSNTKYAINSLPFSIKDTIIPLQFEPGTVGTYTLNAGQMGGSFFGAYDIFLHDTKTGVYQNILEDTSYTFSVSDLTEGKDRFFITFSTPTITKTLYGQDSKPVSIYSFDNKAVVNFNKAVTASNAKVSIVNMLGNEIKTFENVPTSSKQTLNVGTEQNGIYIAKVIVGNTIYSEKIYLTK